MSKRTQAIKVLFEKLNQLEILQNLHREEQFYDDPKFFQFSTILKNLKKFTDGYTNEETSATGFSLISLEEALIKCFSEAAERFCLMTYRNNQIIYSSYNELNEKALDPFLYTGDKESREKIIGWFQGFSIYDNRKCLIPAQLIFINYKLKKDELNLSQPFISTGGAGGFEKDKVLLNGIYEVIERDAFMNAYLNSISLPKVNLKFLGSKTINKILEVCERYKLEVNIFECTNDLSVPSFMCILLDRTGIGVAVTVGAKTSFNVEEAIIGSIKEGLGMRTWLRRCKNEKLPNNTNIFVQRAMKWYSPEKIKNLNFLLSTNSKINIQIPKISKNESLHKAIQMVKRKSFNIYYADITHMELKKIGYVAIKVIIPGLLSLYLYEEEKKDINNSRLVQVAKFFGKKDVSINPIPHPFI